MSDQKMKMVLIFAECLAIVVFFVIAGVYLSKYSDLLQINPFEVGSFGDMIVFKVMRVWLLFFCFHFVTLTDFKILWDLQENVVCFCVSGPNKAHPREHA